MVMCAGIVLFNPEKERLFNNIETIYKQVDEIIIVDNNSGNINCIREMIGELNKITLIENSENLGIAAALNQICSFAHSKKYEWVYLLDQDSISSTTIIESYKEFINLPKVALLTPFIIDINKLSIEEYKSYKLPNYTEVYWAITSGTMIKLQVWKAVGGFYKELFIDGVDFEYSMKLKLNNYKQYRINTEYLLQEVGKAEPTFLVRPYKDNAGKWSLKRHYSSNHSTLRYYYMIRNKIIITRKYREHVSIVKEILFLVIFIIAKILFEKNRLSLVKSIYKGFIDGINFKTEKYKISKNARNRNL